MTREIFISKRAEYVWQAIHKHPLEVVIGCVAFAIIVLSSVNHVTHFMTSKTCIPLTAVGNAFGGVLFLGAVAGCSQKVRTVVGNLLTTSYEANLEKEIHSLREETRAFEEETWALEEEAQAIKIGDTCLDLWWLKGDLDVFIRAVDVYFNAAIEGNVEAIEKLKKTIDLPSFEKHRHAQYRLAQLYHYHTESDERNDQEMIDLYASSAEQGHIEAYEELERLTSGRNFGQEVAREALWRLGNLHKLRSEEGEGSEQELSLALEYYTRGMGLEDARSGEAILTIIKENRYPVSGEIYYSVALFYAKSERYLDSMTLHVLAEQNGCRMARFELEKIEQNEAFSDRASYCLGIVYEQEDISKSLMYYERAVEKGNSVAEEAISRIANSNPEIVNIKYYLGFVKEVQARRLGTNLNEAIELYLEDSKDFVKKYPGYINRKVFERLTKLEDEGVVEASNAKGLFCEWRSSVEPGLKEACMSDAVRAYGRAAKKGHAEALRHLTRLTEAGNAEAARALLYIPLSMYSI
jgi:TPR repeat protein